MMKRKQSLITVLMAVCSFVFIQPVLAQGFLQEALKVSHHYVGIEEVAEGYRITFDMTVANTSPLDLYNIELWGQDPLFLASDGSFGDPLTLGSLASGSEVQVSWVVVTPIPILARKERFIDQRLLPVEGFAADVGGQTVSIQTLSLGASLLQP